MTEKTLLQHVQKIGDLKTQIDTLSELYNHERSLIVDELKSRHVGKIQGKNYTATYTEYTAHKIDGTRLKADDEKLYNKYLKTYNTSKFMVH